MTFPKCAVQAFEVELAMNNAKNHIQLYKENNHEKSNDRLYD
jgi:hypothetical protein